MPVTDDCFECGEPAEHEHHVVPRSKGGTATVPLCTDCHAKVHDRDAMATGTLTAEAMREKREQGEYTGGGVPYGYQLADDGETLVECDKEQRVIEAARSARREGATLHEIAAYLEGEGYTNRNGESFNPATVSRLCNRDTNESIADAE